MKTGCLIYFYGKKYENIGLCALNSFKKHHPEIMLHHVNEFNESEYEVSNFKDTVGGGVYKYMLAAEIMKKNNYEKFIILGADTITCSRLDEFLDNDEADIITTLDYPYQTNYPRRNAAGAWAYIYTPAAFRVNEVDYVYGGDVTGQLQGPGWVQFEAQGDLHASSPYIELSPPTPSEKIMLEADDIKEFLHYNADVVCFNNPKALTDTIKITIRYKKDCIQAHREGMLLTPFYSEQGGLNILCSLSLDPGCAEYNYKIKIADGPHHKASSVVYNARAKGNIAAKAGEKPWGEHTTKFYTKDNKLFTGDGKQIKVWHYCEGLGGVSNTKFKSLMNTWISDWFNRDTRKFFQEQCDTGDFFEKEFTF